MCDTCSAGSLTVERCDLAGQLWVLGRGQAEQGFPALQCDAEARPQWLQLLQQAREESGAVLDSEVREHIEGEIEEMKVSNRILALFTYGSLLWMP